MFGLLSLFADGEKKQQQPDMTQFCMGGPMLPIMLIFGLFMIFTMRANARQRREQQAMLNNMKKGDEVMTGAGVIGVIESSKEGEEEITIRSAGSTLRITRSSVVRVKPAESGNATPPMTAS